MTIYYVSTTGNDANPGTQSLPWKTISKATNTMIAGDTVYVRAGSYNEQVNITRNGTSANNIIYSAYPGEENRAIIEGNGIDYSWNTGSEQAPVMINANYITFTGFRVQNSNMVGIKIVGNYINIYKNWVYNTASLGISVEGNLSGGYNLTNIIIDGNDINFANASEYGENLLIMGVNVFEIKNNIVHDGGNGRPSSDPGSQGYNGGEGIDAINSSNGSIHHNVVYNTSKVGIYLDSGSGINQNIDVYDNIAHDIRINGAMIVTAENQGGIAQNINVYNNIVYNSATSSFAIDNYGTIIKNINIINNTFPDGILIDNGPNFSSIILRNNVTSSINDQKGVTKDHNWATDSQGSAGFVNESGHDYHLTSTSRLIDAGTSIGAPLFDFDGVTRPKGAGFDIGAFELQCPQPTCNFVLS